MLESRPRATLGRGLTSVLCCFCDVITPRPIEGNIEDPDVSNIFTADVNEFDKESTQFQEEADIYDGDSESSHSLHLNASSNQSVAAPQPSASGTNETCYKSLDTEVTVLQSNCKLQRQLQQLPIPFPMRLDQSMQLKVP
jgi:hypothetical protein